MKKGCRRARELEGGVGTPTDQIEKKKEGSPP